MSYDNAKSLHMRKRARERIPGGTQLLSKRAERFSPGLWPGYFSRAKGVFVWDLDGNKYIDMSISGIGANILGYADPDVDRAVKHAITRGTSCSLNVPEEVELGDLLCSIHPWANMVRYARCGGEAMAMAVRIARAHTGKEVIAFCGYHGWHDWYLAANLSDSDALNDHLLPGLSPCGVPRSLKGTAYSFRYNHIEELKEIVCNHGDNLAAIVTEPIRDSEPLSGYFDEMRRIADEVGAVFMIDEITAAFRLCSGGAHLLYGLKPDIAVFAKGMSNGYPMAAIVGKTAVMQSAQDTFMSSTYWTDRIGPVAALATISKHKKNDVSKHLIAIGKAVKAGWQSCADSAGLPLQVNGIDPLIHFSFDCPENNQLVTLFVEEMLRRGFLASDRFYASYAHTDNHVKEYLSAVHEAFQVLSHAKENDMIKKMLSGDVMSSGFHRLT